MVGQARISFAAREDELAEVLSMLGPYAGVEIGRFFAWGQKSGDCPTLKAYFMPAASRGCALRVRDRSWSARSARSLGALGAPPRRCLILSSASKPEIANLGLADACWSGAIHRSRSARAALERDVALAAADGGETLATCAIGPSRSKYESDLALGDDEGTGGCDYWGDAFHFDEDRRAGWRRCGVGRHTFPDELADSRSFAGDRAAWLAQAERTRLRPFLRMPPGARGGSSTSSARKCARSDSGMGFPRATSKTAELHR